VSDHRGVRLVLEALPAGATLIADRGYDSSWFRDALPTKDIEPRIPPPKNCKSPVAYDKPLYRQRHEIENMFVKVKGWRHIATRCNRCAHTFFSANSIAASVAFYLNNESSA